MGTDEISTPWSTLTHRNSLLSNAHATPRIPRSFDEEKGERECSTSSGCSTVDDDDQFPGSPRFYRNRTSKRREHQRQRRYRHGATSRFRGGSRVRRSEALLAALCMSAIALVWIITRDGGVSFPLLSLLGPRAFRARETDSITGIFGAGWAPNDAVQGSMATSRSSPPGHDATLLHDPRPPSEWLEKADKFKIPFKEVKGEPRAIDSAENKHRAGGGGNGDRSMSDVNDPPKRNIDEGAPAQIIGMREDGLHEERLFPGTPVDVHKAVIADTALASAKEKKREWSGGKVEGRPRSKVVEGDVENLRLDVEGKGGGGDAWRKDRANEIKEPPGTNTDGLIGSQGGGIPRKAGLSGGPDDDDTISLHTLSSIQGMTSNAVDLLMPITGKRGGKASPTGVEGIAVANGTPIHLSHRIQTDGNVEFNERENIPGEGKKNPEAKINGLREEKKQEVEETMNMRIEDATAATATDAAAPAEPGNREKQREKKTKKGNEENYDKEALPAEWGGDIDRDDSGKRDMSNPDSKPQRTGSMTELSPALPSEPIDAAIATGGLKKTVRAYTEVAALRIEPVEFAAHLAEEVARDEGHREGRAAGGGGSVGTQLTREDEGVRREQMANEGRGTVEAGTGYQVATVTQRPQRGEVVVDSGKRLRVRPPSRNASRWAQALGAGDDDDDNENHPPLLPRPPTRDQRKNTGSDNEARAPKEASKTCRLTGKVDRWEPPEAADLRSTYRWKDEQKATMEKIRRFSKGGNELRDLIHSEVVRLDILRHDLFCP